ncbi:MAG: metalloregulator ArsR/SmtB family transcription factor [Clostridia bacterium]|nr:metalloregulator ArsR/SmtB family transcription factor [Clostridia bacterium]
MNTKKHDFASCECTIIHESTIKKAKENMYNENTYYDLAEFFKVYGDITRLKILNALFTSEMCVCDISALLGMNQSAISHQLRVLKQARLVKYRKEGKVVYYSLDDSHIKKIFDQALEHIEEN